MWRKRWTIPTHCQKCQYALYPCVPIQYRAKKQYAMQELKILLLDDKAKRFIQQVCRKFLFLGRAVAVDSTLLCPISAIASQSSKPTKDMMRQTLQLLDYLATQEDAELSYHVNDMVLAVHSNASYLSEPSKAHSRACGHFFICKADPKPKQSAPPSAGKKLPPLLRNPSIDSYILHRTIEPAIARVRTPWWFVSLNRTTY